MEGVTQNTEPQIGSKMRVGDIFTGPIGTVIKIQMLQKRDGKVFAMPQNEEWPKNSPDNEGCSLVISSKSTSDTGYLCWVKFDELDIDTTLAKLYEPSENEVKHCMKVYELGNVGPNIAWWEQLCEKIDFDKLGSAGTMYSLLVTLKPYRREIKCFNTMIDRMIEAIKKQGKDNEDRLIESVVKWKIQTPPKEITVDETDHLASFDYYTGLSYAKKNNLKQSTDLQDVRKGTHYVVSCGDVVVKVSETDFPEVERTKL